MTNVGIDIRNLLAVLLAAGALTSCHDSHLQTAGSESHFLASCQHQDECGQLSCLSGTCTRACAADSECTPLSPDGVCAVGRCSTRAAIAVPAMVNASKVDPATGTQSGAAGSEGPNPGDPATGVQGPPGSVIPREQIDVSVSAGCGLESGFLGDEACLLPPPAGEGIQIHLGPSSYQGPDLEGWLVEPGLENFRCWMFELPNSEELLAGEWEISSRPGIHHSVHLLDRSSGRYEICIAPDAAEWQSIPDLLAAFRTRLPRVPAAPENAAIGRRIPAHAPASSFVHYFNFTDLPLLIELWLNVYTPRATPSVPDVPLHVGQDNAQLLDVGGGDVAVYRCPIGEDGRLLSLSTLTMPSTRALAVWLERASGERIQLLRWAGITTEDVQLPMTFRFDSVTTNPLLTAPEPGGFSGPLELEAGDVLTWQCWIGRDRPEPGDLCDLGGAATIPIDCTP